MITRHQADYHNRSFERRGDVVYLADPFSGEPILPDRVPMSIEQQSWLAEGIGYLRANHDITIRIFGENHGDNDISNPAEVEAALNGCDVVFLEGFGVNKSIEDLFWQVGTEGTGTETSRSTIDALGAYKLRQLKLLAGIGKPIFFPEVPEGGTQFEQDLLDYCLILDGLRPAAMAGDENFALAVEINIASSTVMREWYMLARMGHLMKTCQQLGGERLKAPLLWIGTMHAETMVPKVRGLGVGVEPIIARRQIRNTSENSAWGDYQRPNGQLPVLEAARDGLARIVRP